MRRLQRERRRIFDTFLRAHLTITTLTAHILPLAAPTRSQTPHVSTRLHLNNPSHQLAFQLRVMEHEVPF